MPQAVHTAVLDLERVEKLRDELEHHGHGSLRKAVARLIAEAERWLLESPDVGWTVLSKTELPPSGDPHDYLSVAPYWWPSDTSDGLPYVRRDGELNPNSVKANKVDKAKVFQASYILSLAWHYTRDGRNATRAAAILRAWFIDAETAMNPHLNHAQLIPGLNTDRAIGIIDFAQKYSSVLDAAAILSSDCPAWCAHDNNSFRLWNEKFLNWLLHSDFGRQEHAEDNNHGTFAILLRAAIAAFLGRGDVMHAEVETAKQRIDQTIRADGSQPFEVVRTRTWHYSCFNLVAFARIAEISRKVHIDLWSYVGSQGQCLHNAVDYLVPAAAASTSWLHPETKFLRYIATDLVRASSLHGNPAISSAVLQRLEQPALDLWELCLVPENKDAVV